MITLERDLRLWIKAALITTGKSRKDIAGEIGISLEYLNKICGNNVKLGASGVIKLLKYLKYPDLDKLKLEEKQIYKKGEKCNFTDFDECINKYKLSLTKVSKICNISKQYMYKVYKNKTGISKEQINKIINTIEDYMKNNGDKYE